MEEGVTERPYFDEDGLSGLRRPVTRERDDRASAGGDGGLKALYTVPELAELFGVSRWQLAGMLKSAGVQFVHSGNRRLVPIAEIEERLPSVYRSAMLARNVPPEP